MGESATGRSSGREHSTVLYHQINQQDLEEDQDCPEYEERINQRVFRDPNMIELNIHNRKLFWGMTDMGIAWNWHPILMTLSLIFLYGNGALIYRLIPPRNESHKLGLKIGHATIMMLAFILMVIGLQAAFDSHNLAVPPKANMYTLHSWIGLMAALLFGVQWALGFSAFLFPKFSPEIRSFLLPFHQYFGSSIICLAVAAALLGHLEKALWSITTPVYASKNSESQLVNWIGICLVLFVMGVTFLLSKFKTKNPKGHMAVN